MESKRAIGHEISEAIATYVVNPTLALGIALGRLEGAREGWADGYQQGQQEIIAGALEAILTARFGVLHPWMLAKIDRATPEILHRWLQADQPHPSLEAALRECAERISLPPAHPP